MVYSLNISVQGSGARSKASRVYFLCVFMGGTGGGAGKGEVGEDEIYTDKIVGMFNYVK